MSSAISIVPNSLNYAETEFGLNLLSDIGVAQSSVFSPLSILLSLSLVHLGAKGHTRDQIRDAVFNGSTHDQYIEHFSKFNKILDNDLNDVQINIANRIFADSEKHVEQDYLEKAGKYYNAYAEKVDFDESNEAARIINNYISESTKGKIKDMIKPSNIRGIEGMIVNAIYFEADWRHKFPKGSIKNGDFYSSMTTKKTIPFLNDNKEERKYSSDELFEVVAIQYKDRNAWFAIFLPRKRFGLQDAMRKMNSTRFHSLINNLQLETIHLSIPKFKITKQVNLNDALSKMGLRQLFTEQADLSGIAPGMKISSAAHEAVIEVDEWGTRAAAATEVKIYSVSAPIGKPIIFRADHPFLFAVIKESTPLFIGIHA